MQPFWGKTYQDRSGLRLPGPTSDEDIWQAELLNINRAQDWVRRSRLERVSVKFWLELHRRMFDSVWEWAGNTRHTNPNIGVAHWRIHEEFARLIDDVDYWRADETMPTIELLARYHHRLVWIHPFVDGNGRWSRLAADALAQRDLVGQPISWSDQDLTNPQSTSRRTYIDAVKAGDDNDFAPLVSYLAKLNEQI